jgi:predicted nucleotidyltransferase
MRVTRSALKKIVQNTVSQHTRSDRGIISIYLCGSLLEDSYLLGGTTDIDLVFIHGERAEQEREIVRLTDEIHLDIAHHLERDYRNTRDLRVHPWMGPTIFFCEIQYDPQHFMDFTQASVRGQYDRSDHVLERVRKQADIARQIWFSYHLDVPQAGPQEIEEYLRAVEHAVNAVASLSGRPLTPRRFLVKLPERALSVGWPGLYPGVLGLLGAPHVDAETLRAWLGPWETAYQAIDPEQAPVRLHPARRAYYLQAFEALINSPEPEQVLWPLLQTWTLAVLNLPEKSAARRDWSQALDHLGLSGEEFEERLDALDAFLDMIEETIEKWARENGALV